MSKQVKLNAGGTRATRSYAQSATPAFDAVEDIKEYFGDRWPSLSAQMREVSSRKQFSFYCMVAGIEGFPVEAWYDLYWGQGSFVMSKAALAAQATYHQSLSRVYFGAASRAVSKDRKIRWMTISNHYASVARRHLINLIEDDSHE